MDNGPPLRQIRDMTDRILIVGGGLNGPTLALALARAGCEVALIDRAPKPDLRRAFPFDGRAYAMNLASVRMLRRLGLWDDLAAEAQPIRDIKVTDGRPGEGPGPHFMHFDGRELGEAGDMGTMVEDRHLRRALARALKAAPRVTLHHGAEVVAQETRADAATVTLSDGTELAGRLIVGCDGRASGTARRAGIGRTGWGYDQTALVCAVEHDRPHDGVAHQFFMPGGPLAILPLTGNRCSIVWSEAAPRAKVLSEMEDDGFMEALRPAFGSFLGDIRLASPRHAFPLTLTLADRLTAHRVALVGDAAHGIHPVAGQGLNAGLKDVAALAQLLAEARRRGQDPGSATVLDAYAQWRRFDATLLAVATDGVTRLFSNDNGPLRALRDLGMGIINRSGTLRRGFMRTAAGLGGDLPELMRA